MINNQCALTPFSKATALNFRHRTIADIFVPARIIIYAKENTLAYFTYVP